MLQKFAMEQALKSLTQQMSAQNNPNGNAAFAPGSPFPFPPPTPPMPDSFRTSTPMASQAVTVDVPVTKLEDPPAVSVDYSTETEKGPKKYGILASLIVSYMWHVSLLCKNYNRTKCTL